MPNWNMNDLEVSGSQADILKFKQQAKSRDSDGKAMAISLNKFIPMPKDYNKDGRWYEWSCKNWGTKWDAVSPMLAVNKPRLLVYVFDTAWSPPIVWLGKVSKLYPNLYFKLKYDEPSMGFYGLASAHNGEVKDNCKER